MDATDHPAHIVKNYIGEDGCGHRGYCGDGLGFGGGGMSLIALLALLGRGGFGNFGQERCGDGHGDGTKILDAIGINKVLDQLGIVGKDLSDAKALIALEIAKGNHGVSKDINAAQNALGAQIDRNKDIAVQGFFGIEKSVASVAVEVLKGNAILATEIRNDGDKTRALVQADILDRKNDRIRELEAKLYHNHGEHVAAVNKLEVTQTVNQAQAQAQQQQQQQRIEDDRWRHFYALFGELQLANARATNVTKQFGTGNIATPSNANNATNM